MKREWIVTKGFSYIYVRLTSGFKVTGIWLVCKGKKEGNALTPGTEDRRHPDQVLYKNHFCK